jgi:abhydrolase domain-containing protein 17
MVIHGKQDEEVNFHHGVEMHRAVPEQYRRDPWWVPDRGHNDITEGQGKLSEYIRRLRRFMDAMDEE